VYLIIEEINRGNCAQIFGDLFQLLDRGDDGQSCYPIKADQDMQMHLMEVFAGYDALPENIRSGEELVLPPNLYIWATMNTSDQSLFPIDSAFKRRWEWKYIPITQGKDRENGKLMQWSIEAEGVNYDWWSFLEVMNKRVGDITSSEDKKLGFFFCKAVNGKISAETFVGKVIFYLWNDVFKDFGFDNVIFNDEDGSTLSFDKFYSTENGKVVVRKDKVEKFLKNLGVEKSSVENNQQDNNLSDENIDDSIDDDSEDNTSLKKKDNSRYSINGNGAFRKRNLAEECVKYYIANNPELSTSQIVDNWMSLKIKAPYLIETEEEFERREKEGNDTRFRSRAFKISLNNGDNIYVTNQFNVERSNDFIEKVNATDWGIKIDKVE